MKPILITLVFFFTTEIYCQEIDTTDSILKWQKGCRLTFKDFRNPISPIVGFSAVSSISIDIEIEEIDSVVININVQCIFNRNRSFFQKKTTGSFFNLDDSILLSHEQGHFDLVELYSRRIKEKIPYFIKNKIKTSELVAFYNATLDDMHKEELLYDKETNFSRSNLQQKRWNENLLKKLEQYNAPN